MPREYFPRIREAREALRERAIELFELQLTIIKDAIAKGDMETAMKANQWLMEHMPDEDGTRMIDASIDKPSGGSSGGGPSIQIGLQLGGMNNPKALPTVVDVTPKKLKE